MDIQDLTQGQLSSVAAKLIDNETLISRAKADALKNMVGQAERDGDQRLLQRLWDSDASDLELNPSAEEPEAALESELTSDGKISLKANWCGNFMLPSRGSIKAAYNMGFSSMDHEELMELGEDLFYFEDQESHSEE